MFERRKLVKIWRHAHDCSFITERVIDEIDNAEVRNKMDCELRHEHTLNFLLDMCCLLAVDYVAFLPTAALLRQQGIKRIPIDDLQPELIAEYRERGCQWLEVLQDLRGDDHVNRRVGDVLL